MEYEDTIKITTPEGLELDYTLAGAGSRFIAELVDVLLRLAVLIAITILLGVLDRGVVAVIVISLFSLLAWFGYDIAFEVWGGGRTPGKRWSGLRVVRTGGQPVRLGASIVRTLMRLIDQWATLGLVGMTSIVATNNNQRLGDLAAGTLVIRERHAASPTPAPAAADLPVDELDVTRIGAGELATIRDFLARRSDLEDTARARVAEALAGDLRDKVGGIVPGRVSSEHLLEMIASAKSRAGQAGRS